MTTDTKPLAERLPLSRSIEQHRSGVPGAIASGSTAQVINALRDAKHDILMLADALDAQAALLREAAEAIDSFVNAGVLSRVRELVAGWNGENRPEGPFAERHPPHLCVTLPETNCGAVYAIDEAMQRARALLSRIEAVK